MAMGRSQMATQISTPSGGSKMGKPGLWDNINKKRKRIEGGSGERMRSPGDKGAPTAEAIKQSQGKKNGGMVRFKNGGCVMAGRGVRDTKMG
tara:strand:+ start:35 stop:310 length:276 start_codon:yes stop_codon:yes gene_type:complete